MPHKPLQEHIDRVTKEDIIQTVNSKETFSPNYIIAFSSLKNSPSFEYNNIVCALIAQPLYKGRFLTNVVANIFLLEKINKDILLSLDYNGYSPSFAFIFDKHNNKEIFNSISKEVKHYNESDL